MTKKSKFQLIKELPEEDLRAKIAAATGLNDLYRLLDAGGTPRECLEAHLQTFGLSLGEVKKRGLKKRGQNGRIGGELIKNERIEWIEMNIYEIFDEDSILNNNQVRILIRKHNYLFKWLEEKCQLCGLEPFWNGKPLTLQIDHKNGVWRDHRLENLRFLCPNCHTQTDTFCGKNMRSF